MQGSGLQNLGVNVIGHVSGNLGLGVLARHVVSLLLSRRCPVSILDVDPRKARSGHDHSFASYTVASVDELLHPITLLVFPPISIVEFLTDPRNRGLLLQPGRLNAALVNWEQVVVPAGWVRVLAGLDVIVAPSAFSRDTFERALPDVPAISMTVPLWLPDTVHGQRARFGLQTDTVYFGSSFEPQSDPARKNPFAVLDAFNMAFPARPGVGLMIKVNNGTVEGRVHPALEELRARTRGDRRVVLLEDSFDYDTVLGLYASLDVFVSLHRSEGIGLALLEAMALGKPVIATGWSGNMSFMDRSNACLLPYHLVPVRSNTYVYSEAVLGPQAVWAEPDVAQAAEWMRVLVDRPDVRLAIGARAGDAMGRYQEEAHRAVFLDQLRSILESEISWGIGRARRAARRDQIERSMPIRNPEPDGPARAWLRRLRSLATRSTLWPPGRSAKPR